MKKMIKEQKFSLIMMIIFMILTDIFICFDNKTIQIIGYLCLFVVFGFGVYYYVLGRREKKRQEDLEVKRIIEEVKTKKKV